MTNSPLRRRQLRFKYFVIKHNESLELLPLHFCCPAVYEQRMRKCKSKDFMSDERGKRKRKDNLFNPSRESHMFK